MATPRRTITVKKLSWDHICQGSEGSHIANILKSKEIPVDVFFAIGSYAQTILLETLIGEDEAKKLIYHLKECYDLLCVKENFYYIFHLNTPALVQSEAQKEAALDELKKAGHARGYSTAGCFKKVGNQPTKNVYVYHFDHCETASSLNKRCPPLFWNLDISCSTDSILPRASQQYVCLDFAVTCAADSPEDTHAKAKERISILGESGLNNLYYSQVIPVLKERGYSVAGNRSILSAVGKNLPVSLCHTSKPDLAVFDSHKSIILTIYSSGNVHVEKSDVKGLVGGMTEKKVDDTDSYQQLMGGVETTMGDLCVESLLLSEQPIFGHVDIYCLSINHSTDMCVVRKVGVNFLENSTTVQRGQEPLSISEGTNRLISLLESI